MHFDIPLRKRIAIYARVSTSTESQENSLDSQINALEKIIKYNFNWVHIKTYSDVASGKNIKSRHEFIQMINDCFDGKRNGHLIIDQEQAEIVRLIFSLYLNGHSVISIIRELANQGISSPKGNEKWSKRSIETILNNEKYAG